VLPVTTLTKLVSRKIEMRTRSLLVATPQ
jgi:hypothetical protein